MQMMALTEYVGLAANSKARHGLGHDSCTGVASRRPAGKKARYSKPQDSLSYV